MMAPIERTDGGLKMLEGERFERIIGCKNP